MSLTCELSGEPIATTKETVVATPSGHICIKRLLLEKLTENGGMDPFETIRERPLSEDQLVELHTKLEPPPRPQATSLPNLLQIIQTEYDALVLELFDTRKALEETRRELSQALYQNDAAVRVVARLSMERDAARQELERWNASVGAAPTPASAEATAPEVVEDAHEPESKRRKVERPSGPLSNDLPEEDLTAMVDTWQRLHPQRKPMLKAAAAKAPSPEMLASYTKKDTKNWHKSTCRSVICMASHGDLLVTAGKDKQVVVYSAEEEVVKHTFNVGSVPTSVDIYESLVAVVAAKGKILVYSAADGSTLGGLQVDGAVDVKVHPTTKHICVATSDGRVVLCLLEEGKLTIVAEFKGETAVEYSCGAVHPDGLLYAAGTTTGEVHMWDFKNKALASTMKVSTVSPTC
jgi:pre-mRNA-processing factor 19